MYEFLNYELIQPSTMIPEWYRYAYLAFNVFEAIAWLAIGLIVFIRFQKDFPGYLQLAAFWSFGASDLFECYGTTPLLLLFKGALIVALLQGKRALKKRVAQQIDSEETARRGAN